MVQVKIVHGSWKKEDPNRVHIEVMTIGGAKMMWS